MLVNRDNFPSVLEKLNSSGPSMLALDTETTGLYPYHGDRLFSLIIADRFDSYYFNFKEYADLEENFVLPREYLKMLSSVLSEEGSFWCLHNAKFDMHMLAQEGLFLEGFIHDTQVTGRLIENNLDFATGYSLAALARKIGLKKDEAVEEYISKHKLQTKKEIAGKEFVVKHYDQVPFDIISKYGEQDGRITRQLAQWQMLEIDRLDKCLRRNGKKLYDAYLAEAELLKVVFSMEREGVKIDRGYCIRAANHASSTVEEKLLEFKKLTDHDFVDSGKALAEVFTHWDLPFPLTEKGNPSFTKEGIEDIKHPIAQLILDIRDASKRGTTYFQNYIRYMDSNNMIHCNLNQAGAETGRFTCSNPNLQNIPKRGDVGTKYPVKGAFLPPKDFCFVAMDYKQMEYLMMLDYSGEMGMIEQVKLGLDVHEATVNMLKPFATITRDEAKTINFLTLYGGGPPKLCMKLFETKHAEAQLKDIFYLHFYKNRAPSDICATLKLDQARVEFDLEQLTKAFKLRNSYFAALPRVDGFIKEVKEVAEKRKYIRTWAGTVLRYGDGWHYKAPNGLIQGGCAQVVKQAMIACHASLRGKKSKLLLQIHDEILFKVHKDELGIVDELKNAMITAYPYTHLPMDVSVDHSWSSWAEKQKGNPILN